jgi:dihydrolipoamide dehydrogenase
MQNSTIKRKPERFDCILLSIGRIPKGKSIDAEKAGVYVNNDGFIPVDEELRTNVSHIYAIGDVIGQPMLAHKALFEGRNVAKLIGGVSNSFKREEIPFVAYTDPEVAWVGVTESEAAKKGIRYGKGIFPWLANGRSSTIGRNEGITKVIYNENDIIIGAGIVGPNAGDLIAEATLAIKMGCSSDDISSIIHPHPTFSETLGTATHVYLGTSTDIYIPKKKM